MASDMERMQRRVREGVNKCLARWGSSPKPTSKIRQNLSRTSYSFTANADGSGEVRDLVTGGAKGDAP